MERESKTCFKWEKEREKDYFYREWEQNWFSLRRTKWNCERWVKTGAMESERDDRCPLQGSYPSDHQADCPFYGIPSEVPDWKAAVSQLKLTERKLGASRWYLRGMLFYLLSCPLGPLCVSKISSRDAFLSVVPVLPSVSPWSLPQWKSIHSITKKSGTVMMIVMVFLNKLMAGMIVKMRMALSSCPSPRSPLQWDSIHSIGKRGGRGEYPGAHAIVVITVDHGRPHPYDSMRLSSLDRARISRISAHSSLFFFLLSFSEGQLLNAVAGRTKWARSSSSAVCFPSHFSMFQLC